MSILFPNLRPRLVAAALIVAALPTVAPAAGIDFNREIRPILSDNCYHCHGPDEKALKGKLRLDTKEGAFRVRDGKAVLVPGDSANSELYRRLVTKDPDDLMPPPDSHRTLTPEQIAKVKRWIDEGAAWGQHWAFVGPVRPPLPAVRQTEWPRNEIDRFVLARLEKEGLAPAPESAREILLRRVTLDLTGLPPTAAEMDTFLADQSPDAFEKAVDRLLASPRYGERMATDWLDVARYADTHGYQMDRYRPVWPYRDWVIRAFNRNLSFDQFILWQIAGDLLPGATREQRLATAFNRLHMQNEEGGIVEEEYRVAYVVDRVNTVGTAFLGMTFECSRCHDHKYDPISMKDFYSMFSFFQNIDESGQTVYFGEVMPVPTLLLATDEQEGELGRLRQAIAQRERQIPGLREQARGAFQAWLTTGKDAAAADAAGGFPLNGLTGAFDLGSIVSNKVATTAGNARPANAVENPETIPGRSGLAARLNGENGFVFPGLGHFSRTDPFTLALWLQTASHGPRQVVLHHSRAPIDAGSRGYEVLLEDGRVAVGLHHMWPGNSLKVRTRAALATNEWTHVTVTYDGSSRARGVTLYLNGTPVETEVIRDGLWKDITYEGGEPDLALGFRFRDRGFKDGGVDEFRVFNRALTPIEVAHVAGRPDLTEAWRTPPDRLDDRQREGLLDYYAANVHPPARRFREELQRLRQQQGRLVQGIPDIMVMQEMAAPKPARILKRGAYDAPGDAVVPNTPAVMPPFPAGEPRNRLGFARWLIAPDHPLTARVTVNRLWQQMFGTGLVETSDNFGSQGAPPTHPELLDWLARDFADSGWDVKRLLKQIATSATYRQSSRAPADLLARDLSNQLLARGPSRRLTAEMLRDQALSASGLLVEKLGGPSVRPYQPEGLWEEIAMGRPSYNQGKGDDLHRRSLYTFWKRTVPHPAMITFDAAERNVCIVRRQQTSTPLQALALLNDTQLVEAARFVSERMLKEGGATREEQIRWAFRLVTNRWPAAREEAVLRRLFDEQKEHFASDQTAAAKLLAVGDAANDPGLPAADLAAGTILAQALFNHDAALLRR